MRMSVQSHLRHLPDDLLLEILSRLPVKSLLRFRCVSKSWLALADDDDYFTRLHRNNFLNNRDETRFFAVQIGFDCVVECAVYSDTFEPIVKVPFSLSFRHWYAVSSLHGLILIKSRITYKNVQFNVLKVWNPSIRKLFEIPPLPKPRLSSSRLLVHDKEIGLGYDLVANDYKLVKFICVNYTLHSVAIYSLGAGSWKTIKCSNWQWQCAVTEVVYFQSSLNFIAQSKDRGLVLVMFDLNNEVFSFVNFPEKTHSKSSNSLTLVSTDGGSSLEALSWYDSGVCVWALDTESMSWIKRRWYSFIDRELLHIKKNGDMLIHNLAGVKSYNHETKEYKTLQLRPGLYTSHVSCYVESLTLHK